MRNWIFSDLHRERLEQLTILDANVPKIKEALLKAPMITFSKQAVRYSYVMVIFVLNFFQIPPKKSLNLVHNNIDFAIWFDQLSERYLLRKLWTIYCGSRFWFSFLFSKVRGSFWEGSLNARIQSIELFALFSTFSPKLDQTSLISPFVATLIYLASRSLKTSLLSIDNKMAAWPTATAGHKF